QCQVLLSSRLAIVAGTGALISSLVRQLQFGSIGGTEMQRGSIAHLSRRSMIAWLGAVAVAYAYLTCSIATAQTDPLPSWNDGTAKQAIIEFVQATTNRAKPTFVPPEERIAAFDQDGTLWVEHPIYSQVVYCLDRVPDLVKAKPGLKDLEPFKTVMSGDREAIARLPTRELLKILAATLTGMTVDDFRGQVSKWIASAKDPRWKRPYTELTYLPMQ